MPPFFTTFSLFLFFYLTFSLVGSDRVEGSKVTCPLCCGIEPLSLTMMRSHLATFHGAAQNNLIASEEVDGSPFPSPLAEFIYFCFPILNLKMCGNLTPHTHTSPPPLGVWNRLCKILHFLLINSSFLRKFISYAPLSSPPQPGPIFTVFLAY